MDDRRLADAARAYHEARRAAEQARDRLREEAIRQWRAGADATGIARAAGIDRQTVGRWLGPLRDSESLTKNEVAELRAVRDRPGDWADTARTFMDRRRTVTIADCARASGIGVRTANARINRHRPLR